MRIAAVSHDSPGLLGVHDNRMKKFFLYLDTYYTKVGASTPDTSAGIPIARLRTARRGGVSATNAVDTQGKGGASAMKGSKHTRQRHSLTARA